MGEKGNVPAGVASSVLPGAPTIEHAVSAGVGLAAKAVEKSVEVGVELGIAEARDRAAERREGEPATDSDPGPDSLPASDDAAT